MVLSSFLLIQWFHMPLHMPGAKNQIEAQLVKGLREDHFAIAHKANMPIIIDDLEAVPIRTPMNYEWSWIVADP